MLLAQTQLKVVPYCWRATPPDPQSAVRSGCLRVVEERVENDLVCRHRRSDRGPRLVPGWPRDCLARKMVAARMEVHGAAATAVTRRMQSRRMLLGWDGGSYDGLPVGEPGSRPRTSLTWSRVCRCWRRLDTPLKEPAPVSERGRRPEEVRRSSSGRLCPAITRLRGGGGYGTGRGRRWW